MYLGAIDLSKPISLGTQLPTKTGFQVSTGFPAPKTGSGSVAPLSQPARSGWGGFVENLPSLITTGFQVSLANKIAKINLARIQQGLPPLDASQTAAITPTAGVRVGLSPDVKNILMFGGLGIGALVLFGMMRPKKR